MDYMAGFLDSDPNILWKSYKSVNIIMIKKKPFDNHIKKWYIEVENGEDEELRQDQPDREGAVGASSCGSLPDTASEPLS